MQTAISYWRSTLVSAQNLIDVGCPSGLNALITTSRGQICAPDAITFGTPAPAGPTYAWSFPAARPRARPRRTRSRMRAPACSVTLTVTDGGSNSSTNSTTMIYARLHADHRAVHELVLGRRRLRLEHGHAVPVSGRSVTRRGAVLRRVGGGAMRFYADGTRAR